MTPASESSAADTARRAAAGSDTLRRMATVKQAQPKDLNLDDAPAKQCDVFLVDGNGLAYRAFYALPEELQTVDGFPTNALLGMANMLMKLLADYRPATVLVAWDEKPTARIELDAEYKAHRRPMPDLLRQQVPYFEPIVEAFGYRNFRVEGKEADDVIGTPRAKAEAGGHSVCVVSTDRDAFQLASENVCIMMTPRGVSDVVVYTPDRIMQRYGIGPELVPDFIGLKGDTSDNIPGVPGIGDKTAAELLVRFGTMEGVYANLDAVSGEEAAREPARRRPRTPQLEEARDDRPRARDRRRLRRPGRAAARPLDDEGALPQARVPGAPQAGGRARGGVPGAPASRLWRGVELEVARGRVRRPGGRSPTSWRSRSAGGRAGGHRRRGGRPRSSRPTRPRASSSCSRDRRVDHARAQAPRAPRPPATRLAAYLLDPAGRPTRSTISAGRRLRAPGRQAHEETRPSSCGRSCPAPAPSAERLAERR